MQSCHHQSAERYSGGWALITLKHVIQRHSAAVRAVTCMGCPLLPANANRCHLQRLREELGRMMRRPFDRQGWGGICVRHVKQLKTRVAHRVFAFPALFLAISRRILRFRATWARWREPKCNVPMFASARAFPPKRSDATHGQSRTRISLRNSFSG